VQYPGGVRWALRLEGLAFFALAVCLYEAADYSWITFALLFLLPDLSFLGYLAGAKVGAVVYNVAHTFILPVALALVLISIDRETGVPLIWAAHIGFDRMLGYGLKYGSAFSHTHLGTVGRKSEGVV
jgi:hypothetical protein